MSNDQNITVQVRALDGTTEELEVASYEISEAAPGHVHFRFPAGSEISGRTVPITEWLDKPPAIGG